MMRLNTKLLFYQLLGSLRPATVLDVGSLDGTHALRFRKLVPGARIVAFEANPRNVAALRDSVPFQQANIELVPKAVSNRDGSLTFFVEEASSSETWRKGISSMRARTEGSLGAVPTEVESVRLDTFVSARSDLPGPIALWIDVEGASYEVLQGIEAIHDQILLLHVEVETREFWAGQHLKPEVESLLDSLGFACIARGPADDQHDLVYLRRAALQGDRRQVRSALLRSWLLTRAQNSIGSGLFQRLGNLYLARKQKA